MLQIRLSKGGSGGDGGGSLAKSSAVVETVTVACPDHLVLADLPVAKSLGAVTSSSSVRSVGRRSRRHLGERAHFCVRCDFPIAIYGRLMPCEHAFCLACARTDSSCYLCDERIQKIQTIKIMEGIFICAAPHCLKSFLKRADFEAHIQETHADLLHPNAEREGGNDNNGNVRPSSIETQKQSLMPEMSTARAPPKSGFSPSSNSQHQDREERSRHQQLRDLRDPSPRPPLQPKPPAFPHSQNPNPPYQQNPNPEHFPSDKPTGGNLPETSFSTFPQLPNQPLNYALPMNVNQAGLVSAPMFTYTPFPTDGSQPFYAVPPELPRPDSTVENISEPGSVLGNPPAAPTAASFPDNFPRPWGMGIMGIPFQPLQRLPEGFGNPTDPQAGVTFFQGDFVNSFPMNPPLPGKEPEQQGVLAPQPITLPATMPPPPPPPMPPPLSQQQQQQINRGRDIPPGFGWPNDKHGQD